MTEIFTNISPEVKEGIELIFFHAMSRHNPIEAVKILDDYTNNLNEEEAEFARFYFNMRLEQLLNERDEKSGQLENESNNIEW